MKMLSSYMSLDKRYGITHASVYSSHVRFSPSLISVCDRTQHVYIDKTVFTNKQTKKVRNFLTIVLVVALTLNELLLSYCLKNVE